MLEVHSDPSITTANPRLGLQRSASMIRLPRTDLQAFAMCSAFHNSGTP